MPTRRFTAGDELKTQIGALSNMNWGTFGAIVYRDQAQAGVHYSIMTLHTSGENARAQLFFRGSKLAMWCHKPATFESRISEGLNVGTGSFYIVLAHKNNSQSNVRLRAYNFDTQNWQHGTGDDSLPNWDSPGSSGFIKFDWENDGEDLIGRIAVRAVWKEKNPFPSNSAAENAGLELDLANWLLTEPDMLQRFNQSNVNTDVIDLTGNGADETSQVGTSVSAVVPPGFDFDPDQDISAGTIEPLTLFTPVLVTTQFIFPDELEPLSLLSPTVLSDLPITPGTLSPVTLSDPTSYLLAGGWAVDNGLVIQESSTVHTGSGAGKVFTLQGGVFSLRPDPMVSIVSGNSYTAQYQVFLDTNDSIDFVIRFEWLDSVSSVISTSESSVFSPSDGSFQELEFSATSPAGAVSANVILEATPQASEDHYFVDEAVISLTPGISIFDPSIPKWAENGIGRVFADVTEYKSSYVPI